MIDCPIAGVVIRELNCRNDERGWLIELFRKDELPDGFHPEMSYVSMTNAGEKRGPHEHVEQADYFGFVGPSNFRLYLWDNRKESPTYGERFQIELGENRPAAVLVPPGVVHGYRNIGTVRGLVFNAPNRLYAGEGRELEVDEIRHEDDPNSRFNIED